jgi:hypothetical protein
VCPWWEAYENVRELSPIGQVRWLGSCPRRSRSTTRSAPASTARTPWSWRPLSTLQKGCHPNKGGRNRSNISYTLKWVFMDISVKFIFWRLKAATLLNFLLWCWSGTSDAESGTGFSEISRFLNNNFLKLEILKIFFLKEAPVLVLNFWLIYLSLYKVSCGI